MNTAVSCEKLIVTPFVGDIVTVNFKKLSEYVKNEAQSLIYLVNYDSETKDFDISNLKGLPKEDCPFSKPLKALAQMKKFEAKPGYFSSNIDLFLNVPLILAKVCAFHPCLECLRSRKRWITKNMAKPLARQLPSRMSKLRI